MNISSLAATLIAITILSVPARADRFEEVQKTIEASLSKNCQKLLEPKYLAGTFQLTDVKETKEHDSQLKAEGTGKFTFLKLKQDQKVIVYLGLVLDRLVVKEIIRAGEVAYTAK